MGIYEILTSEMSRWESLPRAALEARIGTPAISENICDGRRWRLEIEVSETDAELEIIGTAYDLSSMTTRRITERMTRRTP